MKKKLKIFFILLIIALLICILTKFVLKRYVYKTDYLDLIVENNTNSSGIDPYLVLSIIKVESNFNKDATSNKGARGLMQILDSTSTDVEHLTNIDSLNLYDASQNIKVGINYLDLLIKRYKGNYYLAICAYNAGIGNVDKWINEGIIDKDLDSININTPYSETNRYLKKVILSYRIYKMLYK